MAEAFPSAILDFVLKQLESPFFQRNNQLNCCLCIQLGHLLSKLELTRSVIHEAELMGIVFPDFFREWVSQLECILHELDDLLDEALTRSLPESGMVEMVRLHLHNLPFHLTLTCKIKGINKRLEGIEEECYKCNLLVKRGEGEKPIPRKGILRYNPGDDANGDEPVMIGRDDYKNRVIKMLFDEDASKALLWITGKEGVGKTTLCRAVYNDEVVIEHFEVRLWFNIGAAKEFSPIDFWNKIITALDGAHEPRRDTKEEEDRLIEKIISLLGTRKILLVLNEFPSVFHIVIPISEDFWQRVKKLNDEAHGFIKTIVPLVTAPDISTDMNSLRLLTDLPEEHCWSIFENSALVPGHDREQWMDDLGKRIAKRCLGNPALLRGVGTLLHGKESEEDRATWESFASEFDFKGQYDHYVTTSYEHYSFRLLHQSVSYLAMFSRDELKFGTLMDQLAANGFTDLSDTMQQKFKRQFLWPIIVKGDWDDADKFTCSRLYRDKIIRQAGARTISLGWDETDLPKGAPEARHVSISRPSSTTFLRQKKDIVLKSSLIDDHIHRRSLLFLGKWHPVKMSVQTLDMFSSNLRYLRVLDLQDMALKELPRSLGKLIHLRYLDLSRNDFKELPESVCRLKNLLTLRLVYCDKLIQLPERIKSLRHLKHLEINMCLDLTHMPSKIANLASLQRLDRFVVGPRNGGLRYLERLDCLNGHLTIELPQQWKNSVKDAEKAYLERKKGLTSLEFKWQGTHKGKEVNDDDGVLENLKPCPSIQNLSIIRFGGTKLPGWITLANSLSQITISHCYRCQNLPPFHEFPNLKSLTLTSMNIEYLQDSTSGGDTATVFMSSLKELKIGCMPELKRWSSNSSGLLRLGSIKTMEIWKCPHLSAMPPFCSPRVNESTRLILQDVSHKLFDSIDWGCHANVEIISIQDMVTLPENIVTKFQESLEIKGCNQLQVFWADKTRIEEPLALGFQRLHSLLIENCRGMKHLSSGLRHLIELEKLEISRCSEELDCLRREDEDGMPWKALQNLSAFVIEGFENLEAIPEGIRHLPSLNDLAIKDCKSLKWGVDSLSKAECLHVKSSESLSRGFQNLHSLLIHNCREIKHLSGELRHLTQLQDLHISKCSEELDCLQEEEEDGMPWKALENLYTLKVEGFETIQAIPKGLRHLTRLSFLEIVDCKSLKRGVDRLPKVKVELCIKSCPDFVRELKRERPDVIVEGEEVKMKWLPRSEPFRLVKEAMASTSLTTGAH